MPPADANETLRILLAKVGFDGHDRGIKILAALFRDAGHDVIYLGKYLTVDTVVDAALEEDVDVIGLSFLGGAHVTHCREVVETMKAQELGDVTLIVGGVIPRNDFAALEELGITGIFNTNTRSEDILAFLAAHVRSRVHS